MSKSDAIRKRATPGTLIRGRGEGKPTIAMSQRIGKALNAVVLDIWDEISVYPPATAAEAEAFCRVQIKRCSINLANAKDRGDKRAVINLERKLAVYNYLHTLVGSQGATECPNCRVHTVGEDGICPCCDQKQI